MIDIETIQCRAGMFIGDVDKDGLLNMLWEVVSNNMDQFLAKKCTEISICIKNNSEIIVIDNGEGMPIIDIEGKSFVETVLTNFHFNGNFDNHAPHTHVGRTRGVGLIVVNALSKKFSITTYRKGQKWQQHYKNGLAITDLKYKGKTKKSGTKIKFLASKKIFKQIKINNRAVLQRISELCYLNQGLKINFINQQQQQFESKKGLVDAVYDLQKYPNENIPTISFKGKTTQIQTDVALTWHCSKGIQQSFANQLCTVDGGLHVKGLIDGLVQAVCELSTFKHQFNPWKKIIKKGLVAIINVNLADPKFSHPTTDRLVNPSVYQAVKLIVCREIKAYLIKNPQILAFLLESYLDKKIAAYVLKQKKRPSTKKIKRLLAQDFKKETYYLSKVKAYKRETKLLASAKKWAKACQKEQKIQS